MIILNKLDDNHIQVIGRKQGVSVNGFASTHKISVFGKPTVWRYCIKILGYGVLLKLESHGNTIYNEEMLLGRINRAVNEFIKANK